MSTEIGCIEWNRHDVAHPGGDVPIATGAQIRLDRLVWLHLSHVDLSYRSEIGIHPSIAHASTTAHATNADATNT